eukprot:547751-Rhodomonas_salina.2
MSGCSDCQTHASESAPGHKRYGRQPEELTSVPEICGLGNADLVTRQLEVKLMSLRQHFGLYQAGYRLRCPNRCIAT